MHQRSRHCFAVRPLIRAETCPQLRTPLLTSKRRCSSSSAVQCPFTNPGRRTFFQRCKHCTCERPGTCSAILFQLRPPCSCTAWRSNSSSCFDHRRGALRADEPSFDAAEPRFPPPDPAPDPDSPASSSSAAAAAADGRRPRFGRPPAPALLRLFLVAAPPPPELAGALRALLFELPAPEWADLAD